MNIRIKLFYSCAMLLFLISTKTYSQEINYYDLEYCLSHRVDQIDTYLGKKGYEFLRFEENKTENSCSSTHWSFSRNTNNNRALSFISRFCEENYEGFVWYQPENKKAFESLKLECSKLGFKYKAKNYQSETGALSFIYENTEYKIDFTSGLNSDNTNVYSITLYKL